MHNAEWTSSLERALVRELRLAWRHVNESYFKEALVQPTIELVASETSLGRWVPATRTIEISRALVLSSSWGAVLEVLKHEMAHQYVHEILSADETPHGPAFRDTCKRLGIDGRARGVPAVGSADNERGVIERIAKLLALAESPNQHEAEAAAMAAQRLMLKYNLEIAHTPRGYGWKHLGAPTGRVTEAERIVAMILGRHFFVEVIWVPVYRPREARRGSVLEICGTEANLAIAEYVHAFLGETAARLWREHKAKTGTASNRERRTFLAGVMAGFAEKLATQHKTHRDAGLVWVKDGDLVHYFRRRHPYVRHVRHSGHARNDAFAKGREAGRNIILHRGVQSQSTSRGRLLPP